MNVKRIGKGYYEIVHHGHCFSLCHGCGMLWHLYLCNNLFDILNRVVVSRTKRDAMNVLKSYDLKSIKRLNDSEYSKHKD